MLLCFTDWFTCVLSFLLRDLVSRQLNCGLRFSAVSHWYPKLVLALWPKILDLGIPSFLVTKSIGLKLTKISRIAGNLKIQRIEFETVTDSNCESAPVQKLSTGNWASPGSSNLGNSISWPAAATRSLLGWSFLSLGLIRITVKCNFKLTECCCLNLTRILKFLNPFGLLLFKTINFGLNLESLFILFIYASYQVKSLLLPLEGCFVCA